jgi:hypothetical protein
MICINFCDARWCINFGHRDLLTSREESKQDKTAHLGEYNGRLLLVCEDFFDDFRAACEKVKGMIKSGKVTNKHVKETYISVVSMFGRIGTK